MAMYRRQIHNKNVTWPCRDSTRPCTEDRFIENLLHGHVRALHARVLFALKIVAFMRFSWLQKWINQASFFMDFSPFLPNFFQNSLIS